MQAALFGIDDLDEVAVILNDALGAVPTDADDAGIGLVCAAGGAAGDVSLIRTKIFTLAILIAGAKAAALAFRA